MIAAMDINRLIGNNNQLPWHLPADFAHFKAVTMGKPIVMGRKTYESIGKPLPGRVNIILSRNPDTNFDGTVCVGNIKQAMVVVPDAEEIVVIGGSTIYDELLPVADRMYLTYVEAEFDGDAWFPVFEDSEWQEIESETRLADDKNHFNCRFVTLEKRISSELK